MLNMPAADIKRKIHEQADLSMDQVEEKVQSKMKQLSGLISEEGACHIIANELGVDLIPKADERSIVDLLPGMRDVTQAMRVVQVYELRTFTSKRDGSQGKVCSFLGGDESGVIRVTCWGDHAEPASKLLAGTDIVKIENCYVKENNGRAELHLNDKSRLLLNPPGLEIKSAPKQQSAESQEYIRRQVKDITRDDYRVELLGTVVQVYEPRFFDRKDGSGRGAVMNMMIDDGTGNIRCALWGDAAGKALGIDEKTLISNGEQPYNEERTALLGQIIGVKGRAKLNSQYNTIEMSVDELNLEPDAGDELSRLQGTEKPATETPTKTTDSQETEETQEDSVTDIEDAPSQPEEAVATPDPEDAPKPKPAPADDDAISLDELDDLDLDDL